MSKLDFYKEIKDNLINKKGFTISELYLMYELDCFLVVGDEVSEEKREEIIEKGTAYLYDKWLYETGSTIPELVEDATIDLEEFCNDIGVSLTKEKKSLPPIYPPLYVVPFTSHRWEHWNLALRCLSFPQIFSGML